MSQNNINVQTRPGLIQKCVPGGPASARRYDGHITNLEDSLVDGKKQAGFDMELRPNLGAQFGDRGVGGPGHQDDLNDPQGNRMLSPQPHVIAQKSFYTEKQGTYITNPSNPPFPLSAGDYQTIGLRVDLTQGGTAFRANCVVVRGSMSIINQPIAGTAGVMGTIQDGFSVASTSPPGQRHVLVPTLDFEHIFICQPLHSLTDDTSGFPVNDPWYEQDPQDLIDFTVNNTNPPGPGSSEYEGYSPPWVTNPNGPPNTLGRIATKSSNYFRVINRGVDPENQAAQQFDWDMVESPLSNFSNTPNYNYAQFSYNQAHNGVGPLGAPQQVPTYTQGAATANNVDVAQQSHGTTGEIVGPPGTNLNWVDFRYRFPNLFWSDYYNTFIDPNPDKIIGYSPRVAIKGTYLLI